jgi:hypothetical protein
MLGKRQAGFCCNLCKLRHHLLESGSGACNSAFRSATNQPWKLTNPAAQADSGPSVSYAARGPSESRNINEK